MALIECVPNVSEGRRAETVAACADAVRRSGAVLLDVHSDADHNRSVFTFAGGSTAVEAAVVGLAAVAVSQIDLRRQSGVHPRMGALDVVPFVPLAGASPADCVDVARRVASRVAVEFELPVYFYGDASPERRPLELVRRGGFEGLTARMKEPAGRPDLGPARPHASAGAVAIGVRGLLIAFNVVLRTDAVEVARAIAARVRERDGGLRAVKALGLRLSTRGQVQVSMNLTDFRVTPPVAAFDRIAAEAARLGVTIVESELVGLIPAAAVPADPADRLRWPTFRPEMILENALATGGLGA